MAGTRNRLIHDYFGIDYDIVWDIIVNKLPNLDFDIKGIISGDSASNHVLRQPTFIHKRYDHVKPKTSSKFNVTFSLQSLYLPANLLRLV